ncbi:hypothetical protein [Streptomyces sp. JJ36]|uniref:hypothetical protein n=1 Tax=Streptomyces sp. JJ36 TaxID=2736645 RepID=UPI001F2F97D3|nr:hypothetical protein [Streptomyces sp. JJ36]MCF6522842.1 hypothetical protein [Streptomyces sp. JJ36]
MRLPHRGRLLTFLVVALFGLGHGFAGAATHLPHHPDHGLLTVAAHETHEAHPGHGTPRQPRASRPAPAPGDQHDDTSCETITGEGPAHALPVLTEVPGTMLPPRHAEHRTSGAQARSPPGPRLSVLSVLRL